MQGKICAAIVTPGKANDSPYLREMIRMLPHGSSDLLGDGAYRIIANCNQWPAIGQAIEHRATGRIVSSPTATPYGNGGRRAIIKPDSNDIIKEFNARAEMLRLLEEHPGPFHRI